VTGLDAAALIHDLEYIRDGNRYHADKHMRQNLDDYYGSNLPGNIVTAAFKLDDLLIGGERTSNDPAAYKYFKRIAEDKHLLKGYDDKIKFDS
jgi:TPR repeat protein